MAALGRWKLCTRSSGLLHQARSSSNRAHRAGNGADGADARLGVSFFVGPPRGEMVCCPGPPLALVGWLVGWLAGLAGWPHPRHHQHRLDLGLPIGSDGVAPATPNAGGLV